MFARSVSFRPNTREMRHALLSLAALPLVFALAACEEVTPPTPADPAGAWLGSYDLRTVAGSPLPRLRTERTNRMVIDGGTLTLNQGQRFTFSQTPALDDFSVFPAEGTFTVRGDTLVLIGAYFERTVEAVIVRDGDMLLHKANPSNGELGTALLRQGGKPSEAYTYVVYDLKTYNGVAVPTGQVPAPNPGDPSYVSNGYLYLFAKGRADRSLLVNYGSITGSGAHTMRGDTLRVDMGPAFQHSGVVQSGAVVLGREGYQRR
jgi:hypothetical protein